MCGVITYFDAGGGPPPDGIRRGLAALVHRGPDSEGVYEAEGVFLGHRRLKIIDLSDEANQPMASPDGRYRILYNGEIYNFRELRSELEAKGRRFKTRSDTEVLLGLFEAEGIRCVKRLNGMFAFVIYDTLNREIFAARDHLGIKPIYYVQEADVLAIASEIRALVESGIAETDLDTDAIGEYLTLGSVQAPRTILKQVRALLPGHTMSFRAGRLTIQEYWRPPLIPESHKSPERAEVAAERVRELLEDSVRRQLISDVPLGAFLSGGIDSTAIVGLMADMGTPEIKTFSIGYDVAREEFDETRYARLVAERFGTDHHEFILSGADVVRELGGFVRHLDQPTVDGLNTYFVSKFTREHVTVCLSGLGGDEVFAGYHTVRWLDVISRWRGRVPSLPRAFGRAMENGFEHLPRSLQKSRLVRGGLACAGAWPTRYDCYLLIRSLFTPLDLRRLMGDAHGTWPDPPPFDNGAAEAASPVDAACFFDQSIYMRNTLLRDVDVMSMAHSLEVRVPFLDHRLVEYVAGLPANLRYTGKEAKPLLCRALGDLLPREVVERPKMGFAFPYGLWMQRSGLREVLLDCLSSEGLASRGLFDPAVLERILSSGMRADFGAMRSSRHYLTLWLLMVLELWLRDVVDGAAKHTQATE